MINNLAKRTYEWFRDMKLPECKQTEGIIRWTLLFLLKTPEGQKLLAEYLRDNPLKVKFTGDGEDVGKGSGHS